MTSCFKCNELIAASPMVCAGYCGLSFHRECTGVSDGSLYELDVGSGLLWMCSGCIEVRNSGKIGLVAELEALLRKVLNGVETTLMAAISSLREEILSQFENKQTRPLYADVTMARSASHPLITHSVTRASQDPSHSDILLNIPRTPAATLPLLQNGFDKRTCDDPPMLPTHTPRIWLFLSRFAPTVTEDHVITMVATRLSLRREEITVRKLVKLDVDPSTLRFISFKVAVPATKRDAALSPTSWPAALTFREFVFRERISPVATVSPEDIVAAPAHATTVTEHSPVVQDPGAQSACPFTHLDPVDPATPTPAEATTVALAPASGSAPAVASTSGVSRRKQLRTPPESLAAPTKRTRGDHARTETGKVSPTADTVTE